jgi:hypothetical protein
MKKPDSMLLATFFATCFYSATYPYIYKEIMSTVSENAVAINQIINCISTILISGIWNKFSDKLFPYYAIICVLECLAGFCTSIYVMFHPANIIVYYILDTAIFCLITRNIISGGVRLRAIRYKNETAREHFDNNNNAVSALATIVGSIIAMQLNLNFVAMVWIATIGNMIDNFFYIGIFREATVENKLTENR